MSNYSFNVHTPVYVGLECVKKNAAELKKYGKRAFIVTSDFGKYPNYALQDMEEVLQALGIEYKVNANVIENPPVESVKEITDDARIFGPDFIIGVGGGSALDTAKAVSVLLPHSPEEDPYKIFWDTPARHSGLNNEGPVPVIMAPTTAGTGSEVTASAVLTRADLDTKQSFWQNIFAELAFLDPRYIASSPRDLLHAGVMDALSHAVESYVNVKSNDMTRAVGEIGMRMFAQFKDAMLKDELTMDDYQNMLIASYFDGIAFQCGTGLPHGMGYPLSHHKNVFHGLACAVFQAEYLRNIKDKSIVKPILDDLGFENEDAFAAYLTEIISKDVQLEVTEEELDKWAELFMIQEAHRLTRHPEKIELEDIRAIYRNSLAPFIVK